MGDLTHSPGVDELIEEYHAVLPPGLLENETDQLLAALLMELKAQRIAGGDSTESVDVIIEQQRKDHADGSTSTRGTYHAEKVTAPTGDWYEIELEFVASEVDLRRISGAIEIAFADKDGENNVISYNADDSPVAGIGVQTNKIWVRGDGGERTLHLEAWV